MWAEFNVNHYVRVQLTDEGRKALREAHARLYGCFVEKYPYEPPEEDANGWSKWQLWDLANQLGPRLFNGSPVPFMTTIQIELPDPTRDEP